MSGFSGYMPVSVNSIVFTVPSGQWSGSGSDYYFTVQAPNVTTDSMLDVCYDSSSKNYFTGTSLWIVAANGSFTVHVDSAPAGDVIIKVRLEGVIGEAQYQVLSDVYSKSQTYSKSEVYTKTETNSAIQQSTAKTTGTLTLPSGYSANPTTLYKSGSMVWLSTTLTIPSWTTKNLAISGIIPTGFRPADSVNFVGADNTNDTAMNCIIDTNGKLTIYRSITTAATSLRIAACWMV